MSPGALLHLEAEELSSPFENLSIFLYHNESTSSFSRTVCCFVTQDNIIEYTSKVGI